MFVGGGDQGEDIKSISRVGCWTLSFLDISNRMIQMDVWPGGLSWPGGLF